MKPIKIISAVLAVAMIFTTLPFIAYGANEIKDITLLRIAVKYDVSCFSSASILTIKRSTTVDSSLCGKSNNSHFNKVEKVILAPNQ